LHWLIILAHRESPAWVNPSLQFVGFFAIFDSHVDSLYFQLYSVKGSDTRYRLKKFCIATM